jgi:hypothetical protein
VICDSYSALSIIPAAISCARNTTAGQCMAREHLFEKELRLRRSLREALVAGENFLAEPENRRCLSVGQRPALRSPKPLPLSSQRKFFDTACSNPTPSVG